MHQWKLKVQHLATFNMSIHNISKFIVKNTKFTLINEINFNLSIAVHDPY